VLLWLDFAGNTQALLRYQFTRVSPDQGLSSTFVRKIVQDPFGFLWAGTQDGLNRFDGKRIRVYTKSSIKNQALTGADVRDLLIDSVRSTLWVITSYGGLNGIDYRTGNVWFSFDQQGDPHWKHTLFNSLLLKDHQLYIGSTEGLLRVNVARKVITKEILPYLPKDEAVSIDRLIGAKGHFCWIFTEQKGVLYADLRAKKVVSAPRGEPFKTYDATLMQSDDVLLATSKGLRKVGLRQNGVVVDSNPFPFLPSSLGRESFTCFQEKGGSILISNAQLLVRFRPGQRQYQLLSGNSSADGEKWLSSVFSIYSDPKGVLWLGCQQRLAYAEHSPSPFFSIYQSALSTTRIEHAYYLYPASNSTVYACAQNGLYRVDLPSGSIKAMKEGNPFYHAFHGPRGELIASSRAGALVWSDSRFLPLEKIYPEFTSLSPVVFNSYVRLNDSLWLLGTQNFKGIVVWNHKKREAYFIQEHSNEVRLQENVVNGLYLDRRRQVWVLGDRSVSILDPLLKSVRHLTPAHTGRKKFYSIFFDVTLVT
jgi:ligand-binding sensor domain-containing protein